MRGKNLGDDIIIRIDQLLDRIMADEWYEEKHLRDNTSPICPLPGLGYCVRQRCNFWHEDHEECMAACFEAGDSMNAGSQFDPEAPWVISFYEDYD